MEQTEGPDSVPLPARDTAMPAGAARGALRRALFLGAVAVAFLAAPLILAELASGWRPSGWRRPRGWINLEEPAAAPGERPGRRGSAAP